MDISQDHLGCALTRYWKSSGLSFTPSLSSAPFSGPTGWLLVTSDSPHHGGQMATAAPQCVLKFKAKEKARASFLAIPAAFPVVTLTEPALHHVFFKGPVVEEERGWQLISQACCTPIALSIPQGLERKGRRRAWSGTVATPLPFPFPTTKTDFSECRSN